MKLNKTDIIVLIIALIFFSILIYSIITLKKNSLECLTNPLNYTKKLYNAYCSCWKP